MNRRSLIKRGLFGGALLALGGAGALVLRGTRKVALPPEGLLVLDEVEFAVVDALAGRFVTPVKGPSVEEVRVAFNVDRVLMRASVDVRKEVKQLLKLFENALAGFLFGARVKPFTQLDGAEQDEVLREWQQSRLEIRRTGYQALRTLVFAAYYGADASWPAASYPGPPMRAIKDQPVFTGEGGPPRTGLGVFTSRENKP